MRILSIRPVAHQGAGNLSCVAKFDVELDANIRVRDCSLLWSHRDAQHLVYGPRNGNGRCITFSHPMIAELRQAALAALEGRAHVGR